MASYKLEKNESTPLIPDSEKGESSQPHGGFFHPTRPALRYAILFFVCTTILGSYYSYDSIAVITTELLENLQIDQAQYGLLYSVYSVPNTILPVFGGVFLDRFGVRKGLLLFLFFIACGTGLVGLAPYTGNPYYFMLFGRFVFGLGAECSYVAQDTFCFIWFKGSTLALAMGFTSAAGRLAEIITFNTMASISEHFNDYRVALWAAFGVSIISGLGGIAASVIDYWAEGVMRREGIPRLKSLDHGSSLITWRTVLEFPKAYWFLSLVLMSFYCTIFPFLSYASDFLQIKHGYEEEESGRLVSLLSFASMIMAPLLGYILDRVGKRIYAVNFGNLLMIPACLLLGFTDIHPVVPIMMVGAAYSFVPAALWPSLANIIDDYAFSTAYGITAALANVGLVPMYWLVGFLVDETHDIRLSLLVLSLISGIGLIFGLIWNYLDYKMGSPCNRSFYEDYHILKSVEIERKRQLEDRYDPGNSVAL